MSRRGFLRCYDSVLKAACFAVFTAISSVCLVAQGSKPTPKKVFVITDLEGVDGIFNFDLQCIPYKSPRYQESRKLLTGEVNSAVEGLLAGGATNIVVYDGHYGGQNLSLLDVNPQAHLILGSPVSPTLGLDSSYSALVFIGLHAMAGTPNAILPHSFTWDVQNIWVNGKRVGEIGARVMLAGYFGIPAVMLSGDAAACKEFHALVPNGQCAAVKSAVSATAGLMLPHAEACALIRKKAKLAMEHLASVKPYKITGPVTVKVEFTTPGEHTFLPRPGVRQVDGRTWEFRGKNLLSAWLKYSSF
jgi:D-amino peptidase